MAQLGAKPIIGAGTAGLVLVVFVVVMLLTPAGQEAAACGPGVNTALGTLPASSASGKVRVAQANIPQRSGMGGYRTSMSRLLSVEPDFITLNEQAGRSMDQILSAAPGYAGFRSDDAGPRGQQGQALDTAVLWRADTWEQVSAGRVQVVEGDRVSYNGAVRTWNRYATWALLANDAGEMVSVVSVHHMTNPAKYGPDRPRRAQLYGQGMDALAGLITTLGAKGPVLVGGDFNVSANQGESWAAPAKMSALGYKSYAKAVDFVFYPAAQGATSTRSWSGPMISDHPWIAAEIDLAEPGEQPSAAPAADTAAGLPKVSGLDGEQLRNAAAIIAAAQAKNVYAGYPDGLPARAWAIGVMTAIGESGLRVLDYGDAVGPDSRGLFQQRGNGSWGSYNDRMDPTTSATNFFKAMVKVDQWETMTPTQVAHSTQRNADPNHYTKYWDQAVAVTAALKGSSVVAALGTLNSPMCAEPVMGLAGDGTYVYPVPASLIGSDRRNYGQSGSNWAHVHTGTDFSVACGTPVYAVNAGRVIHKPTSWGGPNMIGVTDGQVTTWYAHMQAADVGNGQSVAAGQQIGRVGSEGNSTGCHLHLEVRTPASSPGVIDGAQNPTTWLAKNAGSNAA